MKKNKPRSGIKVSGCIISIFLLLLINGTAYGISGQASKLMGILEEKDVIYFSNEDKERVAALNLRDSLLEIMVIIERRGMAAFSPQEKNAIGGAAAREKTMKLMDILQKRGTASFSASDKQKIRSLMERRREEGLSRKAKNTNRITSKPKTPEKRTKRKEQPENKPSALKISGLSKHYYGVYEESGKNDTFKTKNVRVKFSGKPDKRIAYAVQTEFVNSPKLIDAYIDLKYFSWLNLRLGQYKIPFSMESLTSSSKTLTFGKSKVVSKLISARDQGIEAYGDIWKLYYALAAVNGNGTNTSDDNERQDYVCRLTCKPSKQLHIGVSHYCGSSGTSEEEKLRTGCEMEFSMAGVSLQGEYIAGKDAETEKNGWYCLAYYKLFKWINPVIRYDTYDKDTDTDDTEYNTLTLGANLYFLKSLKVQINHIICRETGNEINNDYFVSMLQLVF